MATHEQPPDDTAEGRFYRLLEASLHADQAHRRDLVEAVKENTAALRSHERGANERHATLVGLFRVMVGDDDDPPPPPPAPPPPRRGTPVPVQIMRAVVPAVRALWDTLKAPVATVALGAAAWACAHYFGADPTPPSTLVTPAAAVAKP